MFIRIQRLVLLLLDIKVELLPVFIAQILLADTLLFIWVHLTFNFFGY